MGLVEETKHDGSKHAKDTGAKAGQDSANSAGAEPKDRVEQVREILFGAQREEYDRRFGELEELIAKNISDVNSETTRKINALRNDYDKRLARLEELLISNISELSNGTSGKIDALNDVIEEIRGEKVDKAAVKKLFDQILSISRELDITTADEISNEK
ncbi:MAG: hypothetical protein PHH02_05125 [Dehalococcoidales bacterium]|jgi:hypothetical protein|nr:hypothetical protein [Dehalococcoidales bacterium]MDD4322815.1 hypothetical protein [Dehalococcoidales bacterium]MDD4794296.1 hypothetical protein [Dehalococcoidales bacterium]MDD5122601.1 hypothetical protein [Dehalococcoidales bacterium]MDD5498549.1 hypothetical protein [Dehalococcoidales bacterium]